MTFDFSGIKANLDGINEYLKSQGMELSTDESDKLKSIFTQADKSVHKENEKGYNDGILDCLEQRQFIEQIKDFFVNNNLYNEISRFFDKLNQFYIDKNRKPLDIAPADAIQAPAQVLAHNTTEVQKVLSPAEKHAKVVQQLTDKWSKTYKISNNNGKFTKFVEDVYDFAKEVNMKKANTKYDSTKYPTELDQAVDELLAAFANESQFNPKEMSDNGLYHGIFQFSKVGMQELKQKGSQLKILTMAQFRKLDRTEQMQYMKEYVGICKKYYSKLGNQEISAKQVYAMWQLPACGNPNAVVKFGKYTFVGWKVQAEKQDTINAKLKERDKIVGKPDFTKLND